MVLSTYNDGLLHANNILSMFLSYFYDNSPQALQRNSPIRLAYDAKEIRETTKSRPSPQISSRISPQLLNKWTV